MCQDAKKSRKIYVIMMRSKGLLTPSSYIKGALGIYGWQTIRAKTESRNGAAGYR